MKDRIVLVKFYCKNCDDIIKGSINSPIEIKNKKNGYIYTQIHCPYCKKQYFLKNEDGSPIDCIDNLSDDDMLTDENFPMPE